MSKIGSGEQFPTLGLNLVSGGSLALPQDLGSSLTIVLFYRGHWWPYCRRLLAGFEARRVALAEQGVKIIAGSVDSEGEAGEVAEPLGFPVAFGMLKKDGEVFGAWWDDNRQCIQPSEFLLTGNGKVVISAYSNWPIGRMDPEETLSLIKYLNQQRVLML